MPDRQLYFGIRRQLVSQGPMYRVGNQTITEREIDGFMERLANPERPCPPDLQIADGLGPLKSSTDTSSDDPAEMGSPGSQDPSVGDDQPPKGVKGSSGQLKKNKR